MGIEEMTDEQKVQRLDALHQQIDALQAEKKQLTESRIQDYANQVETLLSGLSEPERDAVYRRLGYLPDRDGRRRKEMEQAMSSAYTLLQDPTKDVITQKRRAVVDPMKSIDMKATLQSLEGFG